MQLASFLFVILVCVIIAFLALRKLILWYFKIDENIEVLKDIRFYLRKLHSQSKINIR